MARSTASATGTGAMPLGDGLGRLSRASPRFGRSMRVMAGVSAAVSVSLRAAGCTAGSWFWFGVASSTEATSRASGVATNAGVDAEIRQKLAGHSDERVHKNYTHHEIETLRGAVGKLPSLRKASSKR